MTVTFIALTISAIIILAYILFAQENKKKPQKAEKIKTEYKSRTIEPVFSFLPEPSSLSFSSDQPDDTIIVMDEGLDNMSDMYAEQKRFLMTGIESIFSGGAMTPAEHLIPLKRKNINQDIITSVMGHISSLKSFRTEQVRLQKMINDPAVRMPDFSKIVLSDPMLTAKILRMANSSYFGMQQKTDSISHALMILGLQNIKNIIYREGMRRLFQARSPHQIQVVASLWKHSSLASVCASHFHDFFDDLNMGTLFTLGIIHDIGKLILIELTQAKEQRETFWDRYPADISIWDEDQLLNINHEVIGGLALERWNFSELMVKVIQMHHVPSYIDADETGLTDEQLRYVVALFIANQTAKLVTDWPNGIIRTYPLLPSYHGFVDKNKLLKKILDTNFLGQMREAEAIAVAEQNQMTISSQQSDGTIKVVSMGDHHASRKDKSQMGSTTVIRSVEPVGTIGRYEIIRELGRGAMGVVYLAMDPLINREVAVKTMRFQDADEKEIAESRKSFFSEAKAIGKLSHPNIVNVYDVGEYKGSAYIAMEFLDGTDLIPYCEKNNLLPLPDIVRIISSVATALDYAHKNGVIHRDVKPGNIRILKNGDIKVIDFGIARVAEPSKTHSASIVGSPSYMSPEQINGQSLDGRSDLFSLGVIFYELLTGEKPFTGENFTSLLLQITTKQPHPVKNMAPDIPDACTAIFEKALEKDKSKRYQTGREFADNLINLMENLPADLPVSGKISF